MEIQVYKRSLNELRELLIVEFNLGLLLLQSCQRVKVRRKYVCLDLEMARRLVKTSILSAILQTQLDLWMQSVLFGKIMHLCAIDIQKIAKRIKVAVKMVIVTDQDQDMILFFFLRSCLEIAQTRENVISLTSYNRQLRLKIPSNTVQSSIFVFQVIANANRCMLFVLTDFR